MKKLAFWLTVAGVSILAHAGVEIAAAKLPIGGLRNFASFLHNGKGNAQ